MPAQANTVKVTISKTITRAAAQKTLERLFMKDKALAGPVLARTKNFKDLPRRRGGRIWTKRPNKVHLKLGKGVSANVPRTAQFLRDLDSVKEFVTVG